MKLVSKEGGIATVVLVPDETKPLKGLHLPDLFKAVTERYAFSNQPNLDQSRREGAKFQMGRFMKKNEAVEIRELAIFNNGFIATTNDTSLSESVVNDLFTWLKESFGFREPTTKRRWLFQSDVVCDFENNVEDFLRPLSSVVDLLRKEYRAASDVEKSFHFDALGFIDEATPPGPDPQFFIQRRVGFPLGTTRYFSKAHLPTQSHMRVLQALDAALGKPKKKK